MRRLSESSQEAGVVLRNCNLFERQGNLPRGLWTTSSIHCNAGRVAKSVVSLPLEAVITSEYVADHTSSGSLLNQAFTSCSSCRSMDAASRDQCLLSVFILENVDSSNIGTTRADNGKVGRTETFFRAYCEALPKLKYPAFVNEFPVFWSDHVRGMLASPVS